jgi:4-hydroxy-tetrahydrodipicolinate synthase
MILRGSFTALTTPFAGEAIDLEAVRRMVRRQIEAGTAGLVPAGCTGEAAVLTTEEREALIGTVVDAAEGRVPVIAGTGTNCTRTTIELSKLAVGLGVDAVMLITPYYNKPTQEGLYAHYRAVAEAVSVPVVVYNVPSRTGVSIAPATVARLAEIENIVAIKEAAGSLDQVTEILGRCEITVLSGDDSLTLPMLAVGASGVISVVSNVAPEATAEMVRVFFAGEMEKARRLHHRLFPLIKALFVETNPGPVKRALELLDLAPGALRPPLVPVSSASSAVIEKALRDFGLLSA